jgi:hypothetical protein
MAKLMNPLMSSEARGRVGGTVYNTWRGVRYAKQQTSPAQPRSQLQLQIRAWCTYLVRLWSTIGATPMGHWNDYASANPVIDWTGAPKRLTGLNWYVRCNIRLLQNGFSILTEPPAAAAPSAPVSFAAANGVLSSIVSWTPEAGTDLTTEVWAIGPHTAGQQGKIEQARRITGVAGEQGATSLNDLRPGTYTVFGRVVGELTGLASTWVSDTAVITAA